jgi:hypothetical protein
LPTSAQTASGQPNWARFPPLFIHKLGRSRWRIDAEIFQTITTDCHLKHPVVHQSTALE